MNSKNTTVTAKYVNNYLGSSKSDVEGEKKLIAGRSSNPHILKWCNLTPPTQGGDASAELLPSSVISIT
jgi:hypothetical protein